MTDEEKAKMTAAMSETMNEIDEVPAIGRRQTLQDDITKLEKNITDAQELADQNEAEAYSHTPVSPEQANEAKKGIVFMKKDLDAKKSEFKQLDS